MTKAEDEERRQKAELEREAMTRVLTNWLKLTRRLLQPIPAEASRKFGLTPSQQDELASMIDGPLKRIGEVVRQQDLEAERGNDTPKSKERFDA